jgi:predicted PurR-regulated permease PerM
MAEIENTVGSYVRGQSLVCLIIGLLAFGLYRLIGVPHAPVLGLVYAIGEAVPVVGPIVCTVIVSIVALSISPSLVVAVVAGAAVLQLVENYVLIPRVMEKTVGVNPLVTLLAITAFGSVLGVAGAILAIPLAAIVQLVLYRFLLGTEAQHHAAPMGRDRLSVIRYEVRELTLDIRKLLRGQDRPARPPTPERAERLEDALEGIGHDLERILAAKERAR